MMDCHKPPLQTLPLQVTILIYTSKPTLSQSHSLNDQSTHWSSSGSHWSHLSLFTTFTLQTEVTLSTLHIIILPVRDRNSIWISFNCNSGNLPVCLEIRLAQRHLDLLPLPGDEEVPYFTKSFSNRTTETVQISANCCVWMFDLYTADALLSISPWQPLVKETIRYQMCQSQRADDQPAFTLTGSPCEPASPGAPLLPGRP